MKQCPKCKAYMRWYFNLADIYAVCPSYNCDNCGYDTGEIKYISSDRTEINA